MKNLSTNLNLIFQTLYISAKLFFQKENSIFDFFLKTDFLINKNKKNYLFEKRRTYTL